ncbi:hypothetical protein EDEG_03158 [Edhazardia aedis USNM 41457]|uniref:Uncharacterized protein n=1 Tax=Edhazardia aedis (strain USNM 41457) TaxID=1003232 RepID=J9D3J9_EDHAE|nr:hypothetical protein EDEG_03158 [Edhazardia aedis USNM 41457]|eukprot:EJW02416.1 hypothetical protein EDEG_03158 [Edhazardia aedis USNM 41457]
MNCRLNKKNTQLLTQIRMNNRENLEKLKKNLPDVANLSQSIQSDLLEAEELVLRTPKDTLDAFKKYIMPQENVSQIISFYSDYIECRESVDSLVKKVDKLKFNEKCVVVKRDSSVGSKKKGSFMSSENKNKIMSEYGCESKSVIESNTKNKNDRENRSKIENNGKNKTHEENQSVMESNGITKNDRKTQRKIESNDKCNGNVEEERRQSSKNERQSKSIEDSEENETEKISLNKKNLKKSEKNNESVKSEYENESITVKDENEKHTNLNTTINLKAEQNTYMNNKSNKSIKDSDEEEYLYEIDKENIILYNFESENQAITLISKMKTHIEKISQYKEIRIVSQLINSTNDKIKNIEKQIERTFFTYFSSLIKVFKSKKPTERSTFCLLTPEAKNTSNYLINIDEKKFIKKHSEIFLSHYDYKNIESNKIFCVIRKLPGDLYHIETVNEFFLDTKNGAATSLFIKEVIFNEIRSSIAKILLEYENKYKEEYLVEVLRLYKELRQNKKVHFYFEDIEIEILKIFDNLVLIFLDRLSEISESNKLYQTESFVQTIYEIKSLFANSDLRKRYFNSRLLYRSPKNMFDTLGSVLYNKVLSLSENMKGIQKNVYLINNLDVLVVFYREHNQKSVVSILEQCTKEIVKSWKMECEKRLDEFKEFDLLSSGKTKRAHRFLDLNLSIQKEYNLPGDIRRHVLECLSPVINSYAKAVRFPDNYNALNDKIQALFSGDLSNSENVSSNNEEIIQTIIKNDKKGKKNDKKNNDENKK